MHLNVFSTELCKFKEFQFVKGKDHKIQKMWPVDFSLQHTPLDGNKFRTSRQFKPTPSFNTGDVTGPASA